ncbi:unnamed protein product, partial [Polarella glacialis]
AVSTQPPDSAATVPTSAFAAFTTRRPSDGAAAADGFNQSNCSGRTRKRTATSLGPATSPAS